MTVMEMARQIGAALRERDEARAAWLIKEGEALFGHDALLAAGLNEIRAETRRMPFADREREFWMVVVCLIEERVGPDGTLGEAITAEEFGTLAANFHLIGTEDGEMRDALQARHAVLPDPGADQGRYVRGRARSSHRGAPCISERLECSAGRRRHTTGHRSQGATAFGGY